MPRCQHDWMPLITATPPTESGARLAFAFAFAFALALTRLACYDRCTKCGRLSWLAKSRARTRRLMCCDTTDIERRAEEFDCWAAAQH